MAALEAELRQLKESQQTLLKEIAALNVKFRQEYVRLRELLVDGKLYQNCIEYKASCLFEQEAVELSSLEQELKAFEGQMRYQVNDALSELEEYVGKISEKTHSVDIIISELEEASRKRGFVYLAKQFCFRLFLFIMQITIMTTITAYRLISPFIETKIRQLATLLGICWCLYWYFNNGL
uniref:Uncharacterized protein n=1 Tax=Trichuris muris TaxID=70415 RepID=A0A5S6Q8I6_TRIMR